MLLQYGHVCFYRSILLIFRKIFIVELRTTERGDLGVFDDDPQIAVYGKFITGVD